MNRIPNAIRDYKRLAKNDKHGRYALYVSDYKGILKAAEDPHSVYNVTDLALMAGFMIGYRAGLRDAKRKQLNK